MNNKKMLGILLGFVLFLSVSAQEQGKCQCWNNCYVEWTRTSNRKDGRIWVKEPSNQVLNLNGNPLLFGSGKMDDYKCGYKYLGSFTQEVKYAFINNFEGSSIKFIANGLFKDFEKLESVDISNKVTRIGDESFMNCKSLKKVIIPDSVETIGASAFEGCEQLEELYIGKGVSRIDATSFIGCQNLINVKVDEDNQYYIARKILPNHYELCRKWNPYECIKFDPRMKEYPPKKYHLSSSDSSSNSDIVNAYTFRDSGYTVNFTVFGSHSFEGSLLENVKIPSPVSIIGDFAFKDAKNLKTLEMEDSVVSVGCQAFSGDISLTSVKLSDSIENISSEAFRGCKKIESIIIPNSVMRIGAKAFKECSSLTTITIPPSVVEIGYDAFSRCSSLTNITVDRTNGYYTDEGGVLYDKKLTTLLQFPGGKTGEYTIPLSVTEISSGAFRGCNKLTAIKVAFGHNVFASEGGVLFDKEKKTLGQYPIGKEESDYSIPESVTAIDDTAFKDCVNLVSVTIGKSVSAIGYHAFAACTGLNTVTFLGKAEPASCDPQAFEDCDNLKKVFVPNDYNSNTFCGIAVSKYDSSHSSISEGKTTRSSEAYISNAGKKATDALWMMGKAIWAVLTVWIAVIGVHHVLA